MFLLLVGHDWSDLAAAAATETTVILEENLLDMCIGHEGNAIDKCYGLNICLHSHLCAEVLTLSTSGCVYICKQKL